MGVIGPGIFSDDIAADVRASFRSKIGEGLDGPQATDSLLMEWAEALIDVESRPVFWLALAATQAECGRLEQRVKDEALRIIAEGTDLRRWQDQPRLLARRRAVLDRLRNRLEGPQRNPTRIPKRLRATCDWEVDEILALRLRSGNFVAFRVAGLHSDVGGTSPKCEFLDWSGRALPAAGDLTNVGIRRGFQKPRDQMLFMLIGLPGRDIPAERIHRLGFKIPFAENPSGSRAVKPKSITDLMDPSFLIGVLFWRSIDQELQDVFGLS